MAAFASVDSEQSAQADLPTWEEFLSGHAIYEGWAFGEFALPSVDDAERKQIQNRFEELFEQTQERQKQRSASSSLSSTSSSSSSLPSLPSLAWDWTDGIALSSEAARLLVRDSFLECFTHHRHVAWNWTPYLAFLWGIGVVFRYTVVLPLRLLILFIGTLLFLISFAFFFAVLKPGTAMREQVLRRLLQFWCTVFVMSWTGVIRYHGEVPVRRANQVFVANHTSMIDIIVLIQKQCFAIVGQQHGGWVGWVQKHILGPLGGLWFDRKEASDRLRVAQAIKDHIEQTSNNPLLLFPEGTCVNNEYSVMYKKGAFELGATVCPVAIKYNREWADAFWNSRTTPFWLHLVHLMCGWAVVCDVHFLKPMTQQENQTSAEFAAAVKQKICRKIGLQDVPWDGYLKHVQLKDGFKELRQKIYAQQLLNRFATQSNLTNCERFDAEAAVSRPPSTAAIRRTLSSNHFRPLHNDSDSDSEDDVVARPRVVHPAQPNLRTRMRPVKSTNDMRSLEGMR